MLLQGRLAHQRGRAAVVDHRDDGAARLDHAEVGDGVDLDGDVVAGDRLLGRDVQGDDAQIDLDHPLDLRDQQDQPGASRSDQPPQAEDDAALVLLDDLDGGAEEPDGDDAEEDDRGDEPERRLDRAC